MQTDATSAPAAIAYPSPSVLAVVGPTASGKTAVAIELAERLQTEIISADSMQVYRGMELGAASPTQEEQARVRHHFVGMLAPDQLYSAGDFQLLARPIVDRLNQQGKIAVVVGGSGLYVEALVDGLHGGPSRNETVRQRLHQETAAHGAETLFRRLEDVDAEYAAVVNLNDLKRIVRALEVYEISGMPLSEHHRLHKQSAASLSSLWIAPDYPREVLYTRINERVDRCIALGFVDEVKALIENGFERHIDRIRTLGYREFISHLRGEQSFDDAVEHMKRNTRRFAKRQLTWFRHEPRVHWLSANEETTAASLADDAMRLVERRFE